MKVINGGRVKIEAFLELSNRLLQDFSLLLDDVVFKCTDEDLQMGLEFFFQTWL